MARNLDNMERKDIAYLVNSTPRYYYLVPLHFALVRRYAANLQWPLYMATEVPEHPVLLDLSANKGIHMLKLKEADKYFLESRLAGCLALPPEIKYVLPIQEDFLLGGRIDEKVIQESLEILDADPNVVSIRWMPCPGPKQGSQSYKQSSFKILEEDFMFTYQATIWRREAYQLFMSALIDMPGNMFASVVPNTARDETQRKKFLQIDFNIAENTFGQRKLVEILGKKIHLAWPRVHSYPNAVMLSPWPYRPTAVEKGKLGEWVYEFAKREGFPIQN